MHITLKPNVVVEVKIEVTDGGARLDLRPRKSQSVRFDCHAGGHFSDF